MEVLNMDNIKTGSKKKYDIFWHEFRYNKQGVPIPLKIWQNLKCVLDYFNIKIRLNLITQEIDFTGLEEGSSTRNGKALDIHSLQMTVGLNMSKDDVTSAIIRIAEENSYNPFIDMLKENENNQHNIIKELFEKVIILNPSYEEYEDYYSTIFVKWCLNVVKMAHNTLKNGFKSQGVLVIQGGQGCFKSTFCEKLIPLVEYFEGGKSLNPELVDSIKQNTKYILVEWAELDSTLKGEQAKLKQFITSKVDEYRSPYERFEEKHPRITSYIGTVNKFDFLKDETGSRRFWIIPVLKCDIEEMQKINMFKFWGAVYNLWKSGKVEDYLTSEEQEYLNEHNKDFNFVNDITILLDENIDWKADEEKWQVYNLTELSHELMTKDLKSIKNELIKKGFKYDNYYIKETKKAKKGFKIPPLKPLY